MREEEEARLAEECRRKIEEERGRVTLYSAVL